MGASESCHRAVHLAEYVLGDRSKSFDPAEAASLLAPGTARILAKGPTTTLTIGKSPGAKSITGSFTLLRQVGTGSFVTVNKAVDRETQAVCAIKTTSKVSPKDVDRLRQEIAIMKTLDHPNIINLLETYEDDWHVYLVMNFCEGGDLFEKIEQVGTFGECEVKVVMRQMFGAVNYLGKSGVIHRDIKPENFLLSTRAPVSRSVLTLIDFGLSCFWKPGDAPRTEACGTPFYIAPEVLARSYDSMVDIWSCGVIMYILFYGDPPFDGDTNSQIFRAVRLAPVRFSAEWNRVSDEAKELIVGMLEKNPTERYTVQQALDHPWLSTSWHKPKRRLTDDKRSSAEPCTRKSASLYRSNSLG